MTTPLLKITAFIAREREGRVELLVFNHPEADYFVREAPLPWLQVPAGTGEAGEDAHATVMREVQEESGLSEFAMVRHLGAYDDPPWGIRHVFLMMPAGELPERWDHVVHGEGEDHGMVFRYEWVSLDDARQLIGMHAQWLPMVEAALRDEEAGDEARARGFEPPTF